MYNSYSPYQNTQTYSYVNGIEGARAYQVYPNQVVLLMDNDNPIFYIKTANSMGQCSIKMYKFEEVNENPQEQQYVLRSDFEELKKIVEGMKNA